MVVADFTAFFTGTGKSALIRHITKILREKFGVGSFILATPTGVSAI